MFHFEIRAIAEKDYSWIINLLTEQWGGPEVISRGKIHQAHTYPGYIACLKGSRAGLVTYCIEDNQLEIVSLNSLEEGIGIGTALLQAVVNVAAEQHCKRVWLVTGNDNTNALRFYQSRNFRLVALYPRSIDKARKLKPHIPIYGFDSIPIHDEIEMELVLQD